MPRANILGRLEMSATISKKNRGFTLIELVIVMVLLGILAATALPKFANLTTQARSAAMRGVAGGFADAANIVYAQWAANGNTGATILSLADNTQVAIGANGWPEDATCSSTSGNPNCAAPPAADGTATAQKCGDMLANLLQNPPPVIGALPANCSNGGVSVCPAACPAGASCIVASVSDALTCKFTDSNLNTISFSYNITNGLITVNTP